MNDTIREIYETILARKNNAEEGSYTAYLFNEGIDKILKKIGEESAEVIIAAKSLEAADTEFLESSAREQNAENILGLRSDLSNEVCDLLYHLLVLLAERDIKLEEIDEILSARAAKTGNLKTKHEVDKDS
jgi:phosphoribosyl-ATP pyrophosphohydrolase